MEQRIIYTDSDGSLMCVSLPSGTQAIDEIAQTVVPGAMRYSIVDAAELPADRTFRAAWEADFSDADACVVTVNMPKAREIGHALRRAQRQALLAPLDAEINYAVSDSAKVAELDAQRQEIKAANAAMQTAIDAANTPEAIKAALGLA